NQPAMDFIETVGAQFKNNGASPTVYWLPARYACLVPKEIKEAKSTPAESRDVLPSDVPAPSSRQSRVLAQLALELQDIERLAYKIESQKIARTKAGREEAGPRSATEEIVAGIWARLLKVDNLDIHEDFFALGGHSLLATRLVARIRRVLGVELELRAVFQ